MKRFSVVLCIMLTFSFLFCTSCLKSQEQIMGVWWWNSSLGSEYLDFAEENGVNEIYYCEGNLDETSSNFIAAANDRDIEVYWLIGEVEWLRQPQELYQEIERYVSYNNSHSQKYSGVHLDIEPHQDDNFEQDRQQLLYNLIDIIYNLKQTYPNIQFDYDIAFWLDDEITYNGVTKPAYQHVIDYADRVFIMSYRDSSEGMLNVASEELVYAKSTNKIVILGAETGETEEDEVVTFAQEGIVYMNEQLDIVKASIPTNFGISIHHIASWFDMKE